MNEKHLTELTNQIKEIIAKYILTHQKNKDESTIFADIAYSLNRIMAIAILSYAGEEDAENCANHVNLQLKHEIKFIRKQTDLGYKTGLN